MSTGFKRLHYDRKNKNILLWEGSAKKPKKIPFIPDFYVVDEIAFDSSLKDIHGRPVRPLKQEERKAYYDWEAKRWRGERVKCPIENLCEEDVDVETKFLQKKYVNVELTPEIGDFKIGVIDIEIAAGNGGYLPGHKVVARRAGTDSKAEMTLLEIEAGEPASYEVWTEDGWVPYLDSVYSKSEFPDANAAKYPINLITISDSQTGETFTFGLGEYTGGSEAVMNYRAFKTEQAMLSEFLEWFSGRGYDILTGWNTDGFDVPYIYNRVVNELRDRPESISLLSPIGMVRKNRKNEIEIKGLLQLDYLALYKKFTFKNEESYKLNAIGRKVCGEGKVDYEGSINDFYKKDWNRFVEYNVQDVRLVEKIDEKKKFIALAIAFAYQALVPIDRVFSSVATIEGYIMRYLHRHGQVMPNRADGREDWWVKNGMYDAEVPSDPSDPNSPKVKVLQNYNPDDDVREEFYVKGGHVASNPGFYTSSLCFDVASLYPHMIIQYNISPETKVTALDKCDKSGLIESEINGVWFKREKGMLPTIVKKIFDERSAYKKKMFGEKNGTDLYNYYNSMQQVRKILINSMYGVMIRPEFHFYDVDLARAITRGGRVLIRFLTDKGEKAARLLAANPGKIFPGAKPFEPKGHILSLIDTDSNHLHFSEYREHLAPDMEEREFLKKIEIYMEAAFESVLKKKAAAKGMEQVIRFKREGVIPTELVLAKKKYISMLVQNEDEIYETPKMKVTGVEIARSDTPKFCREKLVETVRMIMDGCTEDELHGKITSVWNEFRNADVSEICSVGSVSDYDKYIVPFRRRTIDEWGQSSYGEEDFTRRMCAVGTPMRNRAAFVYNEFVEQNGLPYEKIRSGSKIRFIHIVDDKKFFGNDVIAWIGDCPKEIRAKMRIDYEKQFETYLNVIDRMSEVLKWRKWKPGTSMNALSSFFC